MLAAGSALAQSAEIKFKRSSLIVATGAREIKFDVELAAERRRARARADVPRSKLGPYDGMLFDFYQDATVSFWMKNTLIPLDMVFIAGRRHGQARPRQRRAAVDRSHLERISGAGGARINGGSAKLF